MGAPRPPVLPMPAPSAPDQPPRPVSRQARSRRTEQALLDAALALFVERGVDAVPVGDIAAAAGVAPATIYRRFGDKEGLVREAFARFVDNALALLDAAPAAPARQGFVPLVADVTALVLGFSQANQRILQSAYAKALADDFYASRLVLLRARVFALLKERFLRHAGDIRHPEPAVAIDFALRQAVAMLSARIEAGRLEVDGGANDDRTFLRELLRSILSYLQVPYTEQAIDHALAARGL